MKQFVGNFQFMQTCLQELTQPRRCHYNLHEILFQLKAYPTLHLQSIDLNINVKYGQTQENNLFPLHLIKHKQSFIKQNQKEKKPEKKICIVYLHGLSSFCLEGKFLIPHLNPSYDLCLFDSRGHGKNKAKIVTYGVLQSRELEEIINKLQCQGYEQFILWGRSMGSVTILNMIKNMSKSFQTQKFHQKAVLVLDSPFSNFKLIGCDIVSQRINLPSFISSVLIDSLLTKFNQKHAINLLELELLHIKDGPPALFLYSSIDQLINHELHTQKIYQTYTVSHNVKCFGQKNFLKKQKIDTELSHNQPRPSCLVANIMKKLTQKLAALQLQAKSNQKMSEINHLKQLFVNNILRTTINHQTANTNNENVANKIQFSDENSLMKKSGLSLSKVYRSTTLQSNQTNIKPLGRCLRTSIHSAINKNEQINLQNARNTYHPIHNQPHKCKNRQISSNEVQRWNQKMIPVQIHQPQPNISRNIEQENKKKKKMNVISQKHLKML